MWPECDLNLLSPSARNNDIQQRWMVAKAAIVSRLAILLAMAISSAVVPNHNPGDDVLRFDLRFDSDCFCLERTACDDISSSKENNGFPTMQQGGLGCVLSKDHYRGTSITNLANKALDDFYIFILNPLTRWDAARFLTLAINTRQRFSLTAGSGCESPQANVCPDPFATSEQAHAFFPLVPWIYRSIALSLVQFQTPIFVKYFYAPTFEGVLVTSALLWNLFCFVIAALALYDVTYTLTLRHAYQLFDDKKNGGNEGSRSSEQERQSSIVHRCQFLSYRTALLFCYNPANVFFVAAYSESTFAMVAWTGFALWERQSSGFRLILLRGTATALWTLASCTRSNGTMLAAWLGCFYVSNMLNVSSQQICKLLKLGLSYGTTATFVLIPFFWHDWRGYNIHCQDKGTAMTPIWCLPGNESRRIYFSLYSYVQQKHWNVGFIRYYELKQIPNFILAAPALAFGVAGGISWIQYSFQRHNVTLRCDGSMKQVYQVALNLWWWTISALREVTDDTPSRTLKSDVPDHDENVLRQVDTWLLSGPQMLGYYAILTVTCVVGLAVAHVQISTRLIFSSCPAIYWYLTLLGQRQQHHDKAIDFMRLINLYCALYIFLGVVLHVNWLPWT